MKRFLLGLVLVFFFALVNNLGAGQDAVQENDLVLSADNLFTSSFSSGNLSYELRTPWDVNVSDLIYDIDPTNSETAESIHNKIEKQRKRLYPDQEILLIITVPKPSDKTAAAIPILVKSIYWWNTARNKNGVWSAQYQCTISTLFVSYVMYGKTNIYDKNGADPWTSLYIVTTDDAYACTNYGTLMSRGYKGVAIEKSKLDVVMYFFK